MVHIFLHHKRIYLTLDGKGGKELKSSRSLRIEEAHKATVKKKAMFLTLKT